MWVGCDNHALRLNGWTKVINKAPGANFSKVSMWDTSPHFNPGAGGELHSSGLDYHPASQQHLSGFTSQLLQLQRLNEKPQPEGWGFLK
jgi:hypothetical protein